MLEGHMCHSGFIKNINVTTGLLCQDQKREMLVTVLSLFPHKENGSHLNHIVLNEQELTICYLLQCKLIF